MTNTMVYGLTAGVIAAMAICVLAAIGHPVVLHALLMIFFGIAMCTLLAWALSSDRA